eukprot:GHVR01124984.1.p1 GENE.GHVR01124984.1~~GHVR01124984.1.p1  ORF type:complete len:158 (+),score=18.96 GHVR01124984.1:451-924(+)
MLFSHAALNPICDFCTEGRLLRDKHEKLFETTPEKCLRSINADAISSLPTISERGVMGRWIYKELLARRVRTKLTDESFCEEHKKFLNKYFGAYVMYIGHEVVDIDNIIDSVVCDGSLVFSDYKLSQWMNPHKQRHTALMFHIGKNNITIDVDHTKK